VFVFSVFDAIYIKGPFASPLASDLWILRRRKARPSVERRSYLARQAGPDAIGEKLDQLVRRLQRSTGRSREACWRFIMQAGLKIRDEHRRWTEDEYERLREHLATHSVAETAKLLGEVKSPFAVRLSAMISVSAIFAAI